MKTRCGFTMIELLVVIAIIGILYAASRPILSQSSSKSREMECETNLSQVAMAVRAYVDDYGVFPRDLDQLDLLVGNRSALQCPRASGPYHYEPPKGPADGDSIILSCVDISDRGERWPHAAGDRCLALTAGGGIKRLSRR